MNDQLDNALRVALAARRQPQLDAAFETRLLAQCLAQVPVTDDTVGHPLWVAFGALSAGVALGVMLMLSGGLMPASSTLTPDIIYSYMYHTEV